MVLYHNIIAEFAVLLLFYVAQQIVVGHGQIEIQRIGDIVHATVGLGLRVDLALKQAIGLDASDHLLRMTRYGHWWWWCEQRGEKISEMMLIINNYSNLAVRVKIIRNLLTRRTRIKIAKYNLVK